MVWTLQRCCEPGAAIFIPTPAPLLHFSGRPSLVSFDSRVEVGLRLSGRGAAPMTERRHCVAAVATEALQDQSIALFSDVCVNPRVLSAEAAEFMLSVAASHAVLSRDESRDAGHADLTLRGVHPATFTPVLLVCTTTTFAAAVENSDVEKALRRALLWRRAVGPTFSVLPVVAGFLLPPDVAAFAQDLGVLSCDISK